MVQSTPTVWMESSDHSEGLLQQFVGARCPFIETPDPGQEMPDAHPHIDPGPGSGDSHSDLDAVLEAEVAANTNIRRHD